MTLIDSAALSKAVEVQKRCYELLRLIKNDRLSLTGGWMLRSPHHDAATEAERFKDLVAAHFLDLPETGRPLSSNETDLDDFANFFVSYLFCSFDIAPDSRLVQIDGTASDDAYCWCDLCARLTDTPNLKLKKTTKRDKAIANSLEAEMLFHLATAENIPLVPEKLGIIRRDPEYSEELALVAYGIELVRRCRGEDADASSLALWRRFAWEKNGTPKKNFTLTPEMIERAERHLILRLESLTKSSDVL